jgi:leucyl/phenylalanyl-tRNA---protein transferase
MQQLPPSEYIFPDPLEVDPEGEGLICIGAEREKVEKSSARYT